MTTLILRNKNLYYLSGHHTNVREDINLWCMHGMPRGTMAKHVYNKKVSSKFKNIIIMNACINKYIHKRSFLLAQRNHIET